MHSREILSTVRVKGSAAVSVLPSPALPKCSCMEEHPLIQGRILLTLDPGSGASWP